MCIEIYDKDYYDRFLDRAATDLGKKIYAERWRLIQKYCHGALNLLDWGCASGAFHTSSPNGFKTTGYDVNPNSPYNIKPNVHQRWDIMTFWDSLEHIPDFFNVIKNHDPEWLFISTPNLESVQEPVRLWKHFRPREHIFYFDQHSLGAILEYMGYEIKEFNHEEGKLRDPKHPLAIISVVACRKKR